METQLTERVPLFILLDTDTKGLIPFYDYVNDLDDRPVLALSDVDDIDDYAPDGDFHVLDTYDSLNDFAYPESKDSRWVQLLLATKGVRVFTDKLDEDSPVWAGPVPPADKARKVAVEGQNASTRAGLFESFGVNYIGRTKLDPRNIFVLDNKKGNPFHDPALDGTLEALYASLPDDWWGSCGFVSTANIERLGAFLSHFEGDAITLTYTNGGVSKLKFLDLDYVQMEAPTEASRAWGIEARDRTNRLSYQLSLEGYPEKPEEPQRGSWLSL